MGMLLFLIACGPDTAPPNPEVEAAILEFVQAPSGPIAEQFTFSLPEGEGNQDSVNAFFEDGLELTSQVDSHHNIGRAWVRHEGQSRWLFGQIDQDGLLSWVALFDPPGESGDDSARSSVAPRLVADSIGVGTSRCNDLIHRLGNQGVLELRREE